MAKRKHKTNVLLVDEDAIRKLREDVASGTFKVFPVPLLPEGLPIPSGIMDKTTSCTVAVSGSPEDGREYLILLPDRVDKSKTPGQFVHDGHPFVTYFSIPTATPAPTGMIWEHASYQDRTRAISSSLSGTSISETVANVRSTLTEAASGYCEASPEVKEAVQRTVEVLRELENHDRD